jgi:hypothetical protein
VLSGRWHAICQRPKDRQKAPLHTKHTPTRNEHRLRNTDPAGLAAIDGTANKCRHSLENIKANGSHAETCVEEGGNGFQQHLRPTIFESPKALQVRSTVLLITRTHIAYWRLRIGLQKFYKIQYLYDVLPSTTYDVTRLYFKVRNDEAEEASTANMSNTKDIVKYDTTASRNGSGRTGDGVQGQNSSAPAPVFGV